MNRDELRQFLKSDEEPSEGNERLIYLAIEALDEGADHHKQWWIEQLLEALGVNIEDLYELEHGIDERNWPERGIAP
jgi:hypothetical protein